MSAAAEETDAPAVLVDRLSVAVVASGDLILDGVSCSVGAGEVLALVGESGSGKSTLGLAVLGHVRPGLEVTGGSTTIAGTDVWRLPPRRLSQLRGSVVSYVPQDASVSLNPSMRVRALLGELLRIHRSGLSAAQRADRCRTALEEVQLPSDREFLARYVHQLSGGQQQRLGIALALVAEPSVIVLDEPTTGLDAITQQAIIDVVVHACRTRAAAALFITHDLEVARAVADRVLVLYSGRLAEHGSSQQLLTAPAHPYTRGLLAAVPHIDRRIQLRGIPGAAPAASDRPRGCAFHPRCPVAIDVCSSVVPQPELLGAGHSAACHVPQSAPMQIREPDAIDDRAASEGGLAAHDLVVAYGRKQVLHGVSLQVPSGTCLGLVGASGSGKTSLSRALVGLVTPSGGSVSLNGRTLAGSVDDRDTAARQTLQYVFQNPYGSLNPRKTILDILQQPARAFDIEYSRAIAAEWLDQVKLSSRVLDRRPDALSGGERQRVAIARALVPNPEYLICDEVTAPLDVSVQASIVELIRSIMLESGVGILFVTHDLGVIRSLATEVAIIQNGDLVELGSTDTVFDAPSSPYAEQLLAAARVVSS